jgi:hypothetical protein
MEQHTERELRVWLAWLDMQWNRPSRTDWYLMRVASEVIRARARDPGSVTPEKMKLKFNVGEARRSHSVGQASALAKARWFAAAGYAGDPPTSGRR